MQFNLDMRVATGHRKFQFGASLYYAFIEEVGPVSSDNIMGPDDRRIRSKLGPEVHFPFRIRMSGIRRSAFLKRQERVQAIENDIPTENQRRRRLEDLKPFFKDLNLPIIDLYIAEDDAGHDIFRAILTPGNWFEIGVARRENAEGLPVFIGAPEIRRGAYMPGRLKSIRTIDDGIRRRLRDIFSLAHVPDNPLEGAPPVAFPFPDGPDLDGYRESDTLRAWNESPPEMEI